MTKRKRRSRALPRGSSKAGRKKLPGARYPNGRLKPPGPNQIVVDGRRAMLGDDKLDISAASDPLDFAHAKGWLTDQEHQAARALGRLFRQCGFGAPRMNPAGLHEVQPSLQIDARSFSVMADDEITTIWDAVFRDDPIPGEDRSAIATSLWQKIMGAMPKAVQAEVFSVCIASSWPHWMIDQARGIELGRSRIDRKERLMAGLALARSVTRRERKKAEPAQPIVVAEPEPARRGRMVEERFTYVTAAGETVLEVVRRRRVTGS